VLNYLSIDNFERQKIQHKSFNKTRKKNVNDFLKKQKKNLFFPQQIPDIGSYTCTLLFYFDHQLIL